MNTPVSTISPATSAIALARKEVQDELLKKAVEALKRKLRDRDSAQKVLANVDREIADLEASIADGSFVS